MKKILITVLLLPLIWFVLPKQQITSENIGPLEEYIPVVMQEAAIPGLAIAKISNGKAVIQTYGKANHEENKPVTENTLFNIASISKPIMGIVLLKLVDQGKLELDRDINEYLPFTIDNPNIQGEKITLRHLVSHSSGIADYYDVSSYAINQDSKTTLEEHLKSLLTPAGKLYDNGAYYLDYAPGTQREYSNLSAALAGYLVEATTGISLAEYSKKYLFQSLAMHKSSWLMHDLTLSEIAVPYEVEVCIPFSFICSDTESPQLNYIIDEYFNPPIQYKRYKPYPYFGNPQYPDGGIRTSIKELGQFLTLLLDNIDVSGKQVISDSMYTEMLKLQLPAEISSNQRFFWRDNSMGLTGHTGSDLGVFSALYFDPQSKVGFIIIMNRAIDTKSASAVKKIAEKLMQI